MKSDTIYRQAAIDVARKCSVKEVTPAYMLIDKAEVMTELMMLPSAESNIMTMTIDIDEKQFEKAWKQALANSPLTVFSAEKKGKWLTAGRTTHYNVCSICNGVGDTTMKFCPNCGARMEEEDDN